MDNADPGQEAYLLLNLILSTNYDVSCLDVDNYFGCMLYNTVNLYCILGKKGAVL